ncbi:MAG: HepT-like ribonuclease domain-containing protein [Candidatus Brocadiia bacterium]
MVGFRNVLVHDYVDLNRRRVYEVLQHNLADLMEIKKALAEML